VTARGFRGRVRFIFATDSCFDVPFFSRLPSMPIWWVSVDLIHRVFQACRQLHVRSAGMRWAAC